MISKTTTCPTHYQSCHVQLVLENYLRNRHQFVAFKNINSNLQEIRTGIPQGSILGPLFFSIYINDLINSSNIFNYLMYADNTTLYFNLEDVDSVNMSDNINIHLEKNNVVAIGQCLQYYLYSIL